MKFAAIIQARMGSTRLPGKVLADICGKPVLQHVIERAKCSKHVEEVFVATGFTHDNLPILELCAKLGVRVYVGSEKDVLSRYFQAANLVSAEYIVRITADCPVYDWQILDLAIESLSPDTDYLCNLDKTLPDGLDIEIVKKSAIDTSVLSATHDSEREHVTMHIRNHPHVYKPQNFISPYGSLGHMRWTLDEPEDLQLITKIYEYFYRGGKYNFTTSDILKLLDSQPQLTKINSHIYAEAGTSTKNNSEVSASA